MTHLRTTTLAAILGLLAACGNPETTGPDTGTVATPDTGATGDTGSTGGDAGEPPDADFEDPPDARAPGRDAGRRDAGAVVCQPLTCKLACPFGYRQDADGCDVCACRECKAASDCAATAACAKATCSAAGDCGCDCSAYRPAAYACPDGTSVPRCACGADGIDCLAHPEYQCPGVCTPGEAATWGCPDLSRVPWCTCAAPKCSPECRNVGTRSEGWYDSCTNASIVLGPCAGCSPTCTGIGTRNEGWTDSCTGTALSFAQCAPQFNCSATPATQCAAGACRSGATSGYPCPDGTEVKQCECQAPPDAACPPKCNFVGGKGEGWYDSCSGALIKTEACGGCRLSCGGVGTRTEGWYSSCAGGLITLATCGSTTWTCDPAPWEQCVAGRACLGPGETYPAKGTLGQCCATLDALELQIVGATGCSAPFLPLVLCADCGDGQCTPPENSCDCPEDCWNPAPRPLGELCSSSAECEAGLSCLQRRAMSGVGICSRTCDPAGRTCDAGFSCLAVPEHAAAGYCLATCTDSSTCAPALTCGGQFGTTPLTESGCFDWGDCDPISDDWCLPKLQCRVSEAGSPVCGALGTLAEGDACSPAKDNCATGLSCGPAGTCVPACYDDAACTAKKYTLCLKRPYTAQYGVCVLLP